MYPKKYLQPRVADKDLVCHLKLHEGSAFDYSLNGNDGAVTGTTAFYTFPGLDLAGADEHIVVDDDAVFTPALTPFTLSAWVNMDDATDFVIATKGIVDASGEWRFHLDGADKVGMAYYDNSVGGALIARFYNTALTSYQNTWTHLATTYDGGTTVTNIKIYLNGIKIDDTSSVGGGFVAVENLAGDVHIGRYDATYANGQFDDVMIFTAEKTAAEILSIYSQTRGRYGV